MDFLVEPVKKFGLETWIVSVALNDGTKVTDISTLPNTFLSEEQANTWIVRTFGHKNLTSSLFK